ncbi:hypothetical protein [Kineosporia mesophila]|uniref:hypothetical protein n=1 Tax=Kineosporia mesophila TaxID=566012 RepID=UPI0031F0B461
MTAIAAVLVLSATFAGGHWIAPSAPEATPDGQRSPAPSLSGPVEAGPAIICADGTTSHPAPHQVACSWHGGGAGSGVSIEGGTVLWTRVDASVPDVLTAPRARSRAASARRLITAYYRALSRGNYRAAFRRLSTGQQERLGPGRTWARKLTGTRYRHVDVLYLNDTPTGWTVTLSYDQTARNGTCTSTVLQRAITTERGHLRLADPAVLAQSPCA